MKKLLITLIATITLVTALPVLAGTDWQAIEHARKAKQEAVTARHGDVYDAMAPTGAGPARCAPVAPVLQLGHGPRAQSTPYQNRLRMERYEAQLKARASAAK